MTVSPTVKDFMVRDPVTCGMDSTVREAISVMESHDISSVVVVDRSTQKPVNILTHRDIISAIYHGMLDSTVGELITLLRKDSLITIGEEEPIIEAVRIFEEKSIEHLPVVNAEGHLTGIVTGTDILRGLPKFAFIDPLTGLENRRFLDYIGSRLSVQKTRGLYVLMIDIDDFKRINDTFGHLVGDRVLKSIADTILKSVRTYDNVIRFGGEEIVVILHRIKERSALEIAQRIRRAVESLRFEKHPELRVTVSIGIAPFKESLIETIKRADAAMYEAKRRGKNRVVLLR